MSQIVNTQNIIGGDAILARLKELEELAQDDENKDDGEKMTGSDHDELGNLSSFKAEYENCFGDDSLEYAEFVNDDYFEEYAQQLAEDLGLLDDSSKWPNYCIDWERAARELQYDYTSIELDGVDYWTRGA